MDQNENEEFISKEGKSFLIIIDFFDNFLITFWNYRSME